MKFQHDCRSSANIDCRERLSSRKRTTPDTTFQYEKVIKE